MADKLSNQKETLKGIGIDVKKEIEDNNMMQVTFSTDLKKEKIEIVMQVDNPLKIADMQNIYSDYIRGNLLDSDLMNEIQRLGFIVNNKTLLKDAITGGGKFAEVSLRDKGSFIRKLTNMVVYFCTFCLLQA